MERQRLDRKGRHSERDAWRELGSEMLNQNWKRGGQRVSVRVRCRGGERCEDAKEGEREGGVREGVREEGERAEGEGGTAGSSEVWREKGRVRL